jgi:hypothetical protein
MGYKKALPITKRSAFKQVPKGSNITGTSEESYLEESPSGQILDTTVLTTDYVTPGSGGAQEYSGPIAKPGTPEYTKWEEGYNRCKQNPDAPGCSGYKKFEFGGGVYDTPGSTEDTTKKPLTVDEPGQPKKTGDAFYSYEKRKQYRTAKIDRNQAEKAAKKARRRGEINDAEFKNRMSNISTQFDTDISNIKAQSTKQFEQGINPRTGRSVTMQEQKDASTRPMTKSDLSSEQLAKLKTTSKDTSKGGTSLTTSFVTGAADVVSNIMKKRNKKAVEDFNKAITGSAFPMKSGFKMKGYGSKNKK